MRIATMTGIAALVGLLAAAELRADEEKVPLDKVPAAVLKAFKAKFPDATIKAAIKEEEDGTTVYEIESVRNGLAVDADLSVDGKFIEIEEQIKPADLPGPVAAALKAKYPKGEVVKAESVTKDDTTSFEVVVKKADGRRVTVVASKDGKTLEEE